MRSCHDRGRLDRQRRPLDPGDQACPAQRASVVQVASRQRTLAERYVTGRAARRARDAELGPSAYGRAAARTAPMPSSSGGTAPAVAGTTTRPSSAPPREAPSERSCVQERRLVDDLTRNRQRDACGTPDRGRAGAAPARTISPQHSDQRLRVLAALTSNVSLNAARTIATAGRRQRQRSDRDGDAPRRRRAADLARLSRSPWWARRGARQPVSGAWSPPRPTSCSSSAGAGAATRATR